MPPQAPLRLPRALVVTSLVLGLAAAAHTAGGGHLPPVPVIGLLTVLMLLPVTVVARRKLTLPTLVGILSAGQIALHAAFAALAGPAEHCITVGIAAHTHHQPMTIPGCASTPAVELMAHGPALTGPAMLAAHVLAVAATALLLTHGENLLWGMLAWLAPAILTFCPRPMPRWAAPPQGGPGFRPLPHPCLRIPALRGPPMALRGQAATAA